MKTKPNILVVCGRNKIRSKTAEYLFRNDDRINIRSVGLSPTSSRKINHQDFEWASLILVMENKHKSRILKTYENIKMPKILVLNIKDEYQYLDHELCEILKTKINDIIETISN